MHGNRRLIITECPINNLRFKKCKFIFIWKYLIKDIKICMLTGDKLETAENIGKSCNIISKTN